MPVVTKQRAVSAKKAPTPVTGILSRIAPVHLSEDGMKILIYGRSKTGKTTLACTFPKPLLLIGVEDGTRSVSNVKGVDFVKIEHTEELDQIVNGVAGKYRSFALDHLTKFSDMSLKEVLGLDEAPVQKSWGIARQQDYGTMAMQVKERLRTFLSLAGQGKDIVIIAQERAYDAEEDSSSSLIMPYIGAATTPSVVGWLNPEVDFIGQCFLKNKTTFKEMSIGGKLVRQEQVLPEIEYCLRTGPHAIFTTGFRVPKGHTLPEYISDPTYEKIHNIINGV